MILFTNGCSWTWGGGLYDMNSSLPNDEKRLNSVWSHHLGKLLGAEKTVNLAMGCGSNSRILRTTFDWIHEQTPEDLSKTVAVIQWTDFFRYEYYTPNDFSDKYENIPERWAKAKASLVLSKFERDHKKVHERMENRLETYTDIEGIYKHIAECDALASLFNTYNIKYYYWNFNTAYILLFPKKYQKYLLSKHKWLDDGYVGWDYERISKSDHHPSLNGHKQLAETLYKKMKEKI